MRTENKKAQATMTAASRTHAVVVRAIGCGSGGGAPVGRRWRRVPWTCALPGWPAGAAGVRSTLSLMAYAAFPGNRRTVRHHDLFYRAPLVRRLVPIMHRCGFSDNAGLGLAKLGDRIHSRKPLSISECTGV